MGTTDRWTSKLAQELIDFNRDGYDLFYILNPVSPDFVGTKPADKNILTYERFIIDLDPLGPLPEGADISTALASPFWDKWVFTGRGFHLHCRISEAHDISTTRARVGLYLRQLRNMGFGKPHCHVDSCTSDASRMVRMPGTINHKSGRVAYVGATRSSEYYMPYHLLPEQPLIEPIEPFHGDLTNLSKLAPRLTGVANEFLTVGVDSKRRSRHQAAFAAAACLRDLGVAYEVATEWILAGAEIATPILKKEEALHCVWTAYKNST